MGADPHDLEHRRRSGGARYTCIPVWQAVARPSHHQRRREELRARPAHAPGREGFVELEAEEAPVKVPLDVMLALAVLAGIVVTLVLLVRWVLRQPPPNGHYKELEEAYRGVVVESTVRARGSRKRAHRVRGHGGADGRPAKQRRRK